MRVVIYRDLCGHHPASCEPCFGEFVKHRTVPDRGCIREMVDDGKEEITAEIHTGGYVTTLVVTDENREQIIYDGWTKFVDVPLDAIYITPPHGDDIRRILNS